MTVMEHVSTGALLAAADLDDTNRIVFCIAAQGGEGGPWRHSTQHNDTQYNDTQHNGLICDT